ncbi:hypothetical protein HPB47_026590, partial [Ixodes persulcatus]
MVQRSTFCWPLLGPADVESPLRDSAATSGPTRHVLRFCDMAETRALVTTEAHVQDLTQLSLHLFRESRPLHNQSTQSDGPQCCRAHQHPGKLLSRVYYISGGSLIPANRKYTSVENENELLFTDQTIVSPCYEATPQIPKLPSFRFVQVEALQRTDANTAIDIIGIGEFHEELDEALVLPSNIVQVAGRNIWIRDPTGRVLLTIYGDQAERFDGRRAAVVAVKGARLVDSD